MNYCSLVESDIKAIRLITNVILVLETREIGQGGCKVTWNRVGPTTLSRCQLLQSGIGRWITYLNSAEYRQIQPGNASINFSELACHNRVDDMWMALNHEGKRAVFDVTPFARFHPGGLEVLLEHAGTDASEAFRMAHAYVNVDMIGRLRKGFLSKNKLGAGHLLPSMVVSHLKDGGSTLSQQPRPKWSWVVHESGTVELRLHFSRFTTTDRTWSCMDELRALSCWAPVKCCDETTCRDQLIMRTLLGDTYHRMEFRKSQTRLSQKYLD
ncbi:unnamed protein product [Echinostoma caproni]|uniref:Cytochrome b5 heme-binding domain-containing protein n=1 Tax=Echinostoma caproni TaxID=27848 RepID=A0A183AWH4_9TREM|nr:unnamed protein product [Echinostoma caproni]